MNRIALTLALAASQPLVAADPAYEKELQTWRDAREKRLRADNGWLTLAGRYPLRPGATTFGPGADNDVVFPPELKGVGPARLGTVTIDAAAKTVTLTPAAGVTLHAGDEPFTGPRALGTGKPDWVGVGRLRVRVMAQDGRYIFRLADNESAVRKTFPGCVWYPADERFKFEARFVPHPPGKTIRVLNVLDQVSQEPSPGYAEFTLGGATHRLDAIGEGDGLFFVFSDATAGDTTYAAARFLTVEKRPTDGGTFTLDFNRAYNPPCAFSEFTTCPTAPRQNRLPVRVEAGEKLPKR